MNFSKAPYKTAFYIVLFFNVLGIILGVINHYSYALILQFLLLVTFVGGALVVFLWWVHRAPAESQVPVTRNKIIQSTIVLIILELVLWIISKK